MGAKDWRRRIMLLGTLVLLGVMAACGGGDDGTTEESSTRSTTSTTSGTSSTTAAPTATSSAGAAVAAPTATSATVVSTGGEHGGTMRWAGYTPLTRGDPQGGGISGSWMVYSGYDRLIGVDVYNPETLGYIGILAESWEFEDGGATIVFNLRKGVKWHDGSDFTSEDVIASWDRLLTVGQYKGSLGPSLVGTEATDDYTAKFKLTGPLGKTLSEFGIRGGRMMQKEILDRLENANPAPTLEDHVGTGPFKFVKYDVAGGWVAERNDDYYLIDPDGKELPFLDGHVGFPIPDEGTRLASFLGGQLDMLSPIAVSPQMGKQIRDESSGFHVFPLSNNDWYMALANSAPFDNYNVRKAIHLALDRHTNSRITDLNADWGKVWGFVPPYQGGPSEAELHQLPGFTADKTEDWAEANRLLDDAGLPKDENGTRMTITTIAPASQSYMDNAVLYASDLRKIGIKYDMVPSPDRAAHSEKIMGCDYQADLSRSAVAPDADAEFDEALPTPWDPSTSQLGACGWPVVQSLVDQFLEQSQTVDPVARRALIRQLDLDMRANEEIGLAWIPEHMGSYLAARWPHVHGAGYEVGDRWFHYTSNLDWRTVWMDQ